MLLDDSSLRTSDADAESGAGFAFQARNRARLMAIAKRNAGTDDAAAVDNEDDDFDDDEDDDESSGAGGVNQSGAQAQGAGAVGTEPGEPGSALPGELNVPSELGGRGGAGGGHGKKEGGAISDSMKHEIKGAARRKTQDAIGNKVASKIGHDGIRQGFESGMRNHGAYGKLAKMKGYFSKYSSVSNYAADKAVQAGKNLAKKGAKKVAEKVGSGAAKEVGKKAAGQAVSKGLSGAVDVAGAATGVETFGLGFLAAFLLNIAISLGVSDAIDALFELKDGNYKRARFLAIRAATKVGMFVVLLVSLVMIFSIVGIFFAIPILICLNVYMLLGAAFKNVAIFQGFVWWEKAIVVVLDVMAFLIMLAFVMAVGWYLCDTTGLGGGGVAGAVTGAIVRVYDWWEKTDAGSVAEDFCKFTNQEGSTSTTDTSSTNTDNANSNNSNTNGPSGGGGDFGGGGAGGSVDN